MVEIYKNAMELLVAEEVQRQLQSVPPRMAAYVKHVELTAYALNQLPGLYATSQSGLDHQLCKGRSQYKQQIVQAVRHAFAAVNRDPIRTVAPLEDCQKPMFLQETLRQLRQLLKNDKLEWETLPTAVEQALIRISQGQNFWNVQSASAVGLDPTLPDSERLRQARQRVTQWRQRFHKDSL
ncbi:late competence development ComFB family protein [Oculatella sp. LEGE 06141]|uniref:late competence development ComFB family protein n=1 Tax=Oculatella sp. LEGE 06141 TaxID=1828648 RepID=UPI00187EA98E|nr:late competence development ComFB family protein [Oculatella sp. LEGE 06141]MBE9182654.1 late competence development ComFB family protein [Oculatella sp. LEGE 06141]